MTGGEGGLPLLVVLVGGILATALALKAVLERLRIPPLVGWLLLGLGVAVLDARFFFFPVHAHAVIDFLARLGVIVLLFDVGLASDPTALRGKLGSASPVWLGNVLVSGGLGLAAARWGLGLAWLPSVVAAVALTATSVGVPAAVWERAGALRSRDGELFVDVAELDDLSGVVLLALLLAVLASLAGSGEEDPLAAALASAGRLGLALVAFGALCGLLARYGTRPLTRLLERVEPRPDPVLSVAALGILLAGLAGLLGFSVAIGAFFAGLAFSRASMPIREHDSYAALRDLFVPFFFVGTGLRIEPEALTGAALPAALLLAAAVLGKLLGTLPAARLVTGATGAWALAWSMVPRAEIALVVAGRSRDFGEPIMPAELYSALVVVVALTCLGAPPLIRMLLERRGPE